MEPLATEIDAGAGWHTPVPPGHPAARLLTADAVRERCAQVMAAVEAGGTTFWQWRTDRVSVAADYVVATIRRRHPDLAVPFHSRWRHFAAGGPDRWAALADAAGLAGAERARTAIDLVIPSVLLDAGAGPRWSYRDAATGSTFVRSEGLGVASLALFATGAFSAVPGTALRTDAAGLRDIDARRLAAGFQADDGNPLVGLEGRAALLRRLGEVVAATPAVFGTAGRLGRLFDFLRVHSSPGPRGAVISARLLLATLLRALGPAWPSRLALDGVPLGDCWNHPAVAATAPGDPTAGLVPFHKLTQWLAYSLLEPLAEGGIEVVELEGLTGLPEYRNGGLLIDLEVVVPRPGADFDPARQTFTVDHPAIVEWRALTVIGLDRIAAAVRSRLGVSAEAFPLARVLEGGTWAAGRAIAAERRPGGTPPLAIASDGTVF